MGRLRVGIVFGGKSGEHDVSLMSAVSVIKYLPMEKFEPIPIGITKHGKWITGGDPWQILKTNPPPTEGAPIPIDVLTSLDVVFPVLHGTYGEDGTIQGLFEMCNVPYVGAGVMSSSVCMDKAVMKNVFRDHGLPVATEKVVMRSTWQLDRAQVLREITGNFGFPVFVKPANLGSSVGISKARNEDELAGALDLAGQYDYKLIVEEFIPGRELECAILGNHDPQASIIGEIVPHNEFYDYEAKYTDGKADLIIPAMLDPGIVIQLQTLALAAYRAVDCTGLARVDFFMHKITGRLILNEINTLPGFTHLSMYPLLWNASGIDYPSLVTRLIELALERHQERQLLSVSRP